MQLAAMRAPALGLVVTGEGEGDGDGYAVGLHPMATARVLPTR